MIKIISIFLLLPTVCFSHNVIFSIIEGGIGLEIYYDDIVKTPMFYSKFKVFSPEDRDEIFQEGFTDINGKFVFFPDKPGEWKIEVNDGMGHGIVTNINVTKELNYEKEESRNFSIWQKIIIGLSIILGISGILFYISSKRQFSKEKNAHS